GSSLPRVPCQTTPCKVLTEMPLRLGKVRRAHWQKLRAEMPNSLARGSIFPKLSRVGRSGFAIQCTNNRRLSNGVAINDAPPNQSDYSPDEEVGCKGRAREKPR